MSETRVKKPSSPILDMNPMVDMAFLLVTFFLLATTFKSAEPTKITLAKSISNLEIEEKEMITVTVNRNGEAFIGLGDPAMRVLLLEKMAFVHGIKLNENERKIFSGLTGIGMPISELADFLALKEEQRVNYLQPGIPRDAANNELADWIIMARSIMPRARVALKADRRSPYKDVDDIIDIFKNNNILRFNLITDIRRIDGI